jgi:transmembrane sensor
MDNRMDDRMDSRTIEDIAATWIIRRGDEGWTQSDERTLTQWLDASIRHRVAFLRLEAAWEQASRLQALGAGTPAGAVPPPGRWQVSPLFDQHSTSASEQLTAAPSKPSRRKVAGRWAAIAAGVLVVIGVAFQVFDSLQAERYFTPVGGMASIPLRDGSQITLNTATRIKVHLDRKERLVELEGGEAYFDVAKDPARPFVVEAGTQRIVAVGTSFAVRRQAGGQIEVVVTEGKVRIEPSAQGDFALVERPAEQRPAEILLTPGSIARGGDDRMVLEQEQLAELEKRLSWRSGYLTFDSMPLGDAIAEFNRYSPLQIEVGSSQLRELPISGRFKATNVQAFLRVLNEGFGIQAREYDGVILLDR